jgi:hypothetical protein
MDRKPPNDNSRRKGSHKTHWCEVWVAIVFQA